jgi:hypothetical protein
MDKGLALLAEEVEASLVLDDDLAERALKVVNELSAEHKIGRADLDSTDKVLGIIYAVRPGWSVSIRGTMSRPNGHWRCTLRRSLGRDNDDYLGVGRGPTLQHSLLAALLKAMSFAGG